MKNFLIILATTATIVGCHRHEATTPGFAVDFRTFYQELPYREQTRTFREAGPGHSHYRVDYRDFRGQFGPREEARLFGEELRFKDDSRSFRDDSRSFRDDLRPFKDDSRPFKDDSRAFRDSLRLFKDDSRPFKDDLRPFKDDSRSFKDDLRPFRDDSRSFKDGSKSFKEELRLFKDYSRPFKDDSRSFRDERIFREDIRGHRLRDDSPRPLRDEIRTFREELRPFKDEIVRPYDDQGSRNFRDDIRNFRNNEVRVFRDEANGFREERPFAEEETLRSEHTPFREEVRPFKEELLFTQESEGIAEAQHHFNKEQEREHRPLTYDGHSNYLKYGNHGLGYAAIPSAILPLEDGPPRLASGMLIPDMTTTAATQSPSYLSKNDISGGPSSSGGSESAITQSHVTVTLAPEVGSTPSQMSPGTGMNGRPVSQQQPRNENLMDGGSISSTPAITTSGTGAPKVLFTSGANSPMTMSPEGESGLMRGGSSPNSLHPNKQGMSGLATQSSYYQSENGRPEVPEGILNYVLKYQMPDHETKMRYAYRNSLQPDSYAGHVPIIQAAKYAIIPELKLSGLDGINRQPGASLNYPGATIAKPYLTASSPNTLTLTNPTFQTDNVPTVNFGGNLIQLEQMGSVQSSQYPQLRQILPSSEYIPQLGQYANLGQPGRQSTGVPFAQGGLQLQLSNFGGLDYNALTGSADSTRVASPMNLGLGETSGSAGSTFAKISFGEPLWQL